MKKLLQINSVVNTGSTGRIAEDIGKSAIDTGWKSYIAYGRTSRPSKSNLIKIGNKNDIWFHGLQTRIFDKHGLASSKVTTKFVEQIIELQPDIIHIHNLHGYYINYEILFNYLNTLNTPIIWTLHDCWPFTGHCCYFDNIGCDKWKKECNNCPQKTLYPSSYIFDKSIHNFKLKKILFQNKNITFVPVSRWLNALLKQSFLSSSNSQVINNGVDLSIFYPNMEMGIKHKLGLQQEKVILGVASPWSGRKGLNDFIELSKQLNPHFKIILIGVTPEQKKQLPEKVIGILKTESVEELAYYYSIADVFVNPTWEDNFPTTNLEALACGTPVITYDTGGSPEAIDDLTGIVVKKGCITSLIAAINKVTENGKKFYSSKCIERAHEKYDKYKNYNDYISLYNLKLR